MLWRLVILILCRFSSRQLHTLSKTKYSKKGNSSAQGGALYEESTKD